jgi:glycosyltransferase involved in cell wall biosynthesis
MILNKRIAVVLPAYNAAHTLEKTFREIPLEVVDEVILVDDKSTDDTLKIAQELGIKHIINHKKNKGYGGNQKSCYDAALKLNVDIVIMVHPDYQYTPKLIQSMAYIIAQEVYPVVFGSRILGTGALKGGMPIYKYIANRLLTLIQNVFIGQHLSEYHTGYRAFSTNILKGIDYHRCSDDFLFDNQICSQIFMKGHEIAEITCPTKYFKEASSINFQRSLIYGLGVLKVSLLHFLHKKKIYTCSLYHEPIAPTS